MTAIALMICRFWLTDLSYHAVPMSLPPPRRYLTRFDIAALEKAYAGDQRGLPFCYTHG